jgi:hypothetical protein
MPVLITAVVPEQTQEGCDQFNKRRASSLTSPEGWRGFEIWEQKEASDFLPSTCIRTYLPA